MSHFSSHADHLRAKLMKKHSVRYVNETAIAIDATSVSGLIPPSSSQLSSNSVIQNISKDNVDQSTSSFVSPSNGNVVVKTPENLIDYRDKIGQTFSFIITGNTEGSVWGTDVYSDDSNLAAAAVHAGAVNHGETNTVHIKILPSALSYQGSIRNGVTTSSYGEWEGSYEFIGIPVTTAIIIPDLKIYRDRVGQTFSFMITGSIKGSVWGTDIYTDDSNLAAAALHAGAIKNGETNTVDIKILPSAFTYQGSTRHGITSSSFDEWDGSYEFIGIAVTNAINVPNLKIHRDKVGHTFSFMITGSIKGSVWGTDIYSDDSNLAAAAVHAGVVDNGEVKMINIKILPGQSEYQGSTQNGITSSEYGIWKGSYLFVTDTINLDMSPLNNTTDQSKLVK